MLPAPMHTMRDMAAHAVTKPWHRLEGVVAGDQCEGKYGGTLARKQRGWFHTCSDASPE
jgi:hypothetical protein